MPPKSTKRDQKSLWLVCDKCGVKVIQIKSKSHEKYCGTLLLGIVNEKFITSSLTASLPSELNIKDAPTLYLQRFIFIPESICSILNFTMGFNLLIEINGEKFVRSLWTITDKYSDEIFSSSEGEDLIFDLNEFL